jgi:hypothetical protein
VARDPNRPKLTLVTPENQEEYSGGGSNGGNGGGIGGGMETRVAVLEAHMEHVREDLRVMKSDVSTLKTDVATLVERVAHLPSKGFIATVVIGTAAILAALGAFAPALKRLLGIP